jgi:hypothetical protein
MTITRSFQEETIQDDTNSTVDDEVEHPKMFLELNVISWDYSKCLDVGQVRVYPVF